MNGIKIILQKELTRVFKDRKLIFTLFILPAILILLIFSLTGKMSSSMLEDIESHIPYIYIQNYPEGLNEYITGTEFNGNVNYIDSDFDTTSIKDGILNGEIDLLISFEDGFLDKINNYQDGNVIPEIKTYYNPSEDYSNQARQTFLSVVLEPYRSKFLTERFGDLSNIAVFSIDADNSESAIMNEEKAGGKALGMMLPYMITMLLFSGAMSLGIDSITGEKERGTMASMLITPLKRGEIVAGKLLSLSILACLSASVYVVSMVIAMPVMLNSMSNNTGLVFHLSALQIIQLLLIMLSLVFFYVNIIVLVAVFARTAKEANTYIMPLYIIVIIGGLFTIFQGNASQTLLSFAIPVYGSAICIQELLAGELAAIELVVSLCGTLGVSAILFACITKAFNSEKIMFNA